MRIPFLAKNQHKALLHQSIERLKEIRTVDSILAICPTTTGYDWMGVNVATKSLFPKNTFEIPQYYSSSMFTSEELEKIIATINELDFEQVVFSGAPSYFFSISEKLTKSVSQRYIYHGFLAELSENKLAQDNLTRLIELTRKGIIANLGFVKKGLALSIQERFKVPCHEVILPNKNVLSSPKTAPDTIKIGCLLNNSFRKNIHNQAMAGTMIEGAEVHVFKTPELGYLNFPFVEHSLMEHSEFIALIGSMTLNLHVTFSEGMGGQVCAESISQGVPCLSGNTSSFFDYDEELKEHLIVSGVDDSWHIYQKIQSVLSNREYLSRRCLDYSVYLNHLAADRLKEFLS